MEGQLVLTAERKNFTADKARFPDEKVREYQYVTGTVTTAPDRFGVVKKDWNPAPATFDFEYGWIEARIKLPKGKGLWPALWLLRSDGTWPPEIDVLEMVDPQGQHIAQHLHWGPKGQDNDWTINHNLGFKTALVDLSADFHVYGLDWSPDRIAWYIDGTVTQECTDRRILDYFKGAHYLLLNLAVGMSGPVTPTHPQSSRPR